MPIVAGVSPQEFLSLSGAPFLAFATSSSQLFRPLVSSRSFSKNNEANMRLELDEFTLDDERASNEDADDVEELRCLRFLSRERLRFFSFFDFFGLRLRSRPMAARNQ